jgi:predicted ATP-grasp superfamily ATP-dependent carboligase
MLIAAFEGWTDAGGAATGAASYLAKAWHARRFASIDAEEFFDFTQRRPLVSLTNDLTREIIWPPNHFLAASTGDTHDVILLIGTEPHMRWKTFAGYVIEVARELKVESVFTLGSMLGQAVHTRPATVRVSTADPALGSRLGLKPPQYQGPTGIVGVLQDALAQAGIPAGSMMTQVPHYVPATPSPKATIALVKQVCGLAGTNVSTFDLEQAALRYEREVTEAVAASSDIADYVTQLESRMDDSAGTGEEDLPSGDALIAQLEEFLREQGDTP